jgi:hypothetical protein
MGTEGLLPSWPGKEGQLLRNQKECAPAGNKGNQRAGKQVARLARLVVGLLIRPDRCAVKRNYNRVELELVLAGQSMIHSRETAHQMR